MKYSIKESSLTDLSLGCLFSNDMLLETIVSKM